MSNPMWAIAAYFNPYQDRRILRNLRRFRQDLELPLLLIEHVHDGVPRLTPAEADVLVQVHGGDVLWQKERLFNLGLRHLPPECKYVAWLDADLRFLRPNWSRVALQLLQKSCLVQLFDVVFEQNPNGGGRHSWRRRSLVASLESAMVTDAVFGTSGRSLVHGYSPGHAWAGRVEVLSQHGFYDALPLGSGDKALAAAAYDQHDALPRALRLSDAHAEHYRAWAVDFSSSIQGKIACLAGTVEHFWHGSLDDRRYSSRYHDFARFGFDPVRDLGANHDQPLIWRTQNSSMKEYVRRYFLKRAERREPSPWIGV